MARLCPRVGDRCLKPRQRSVLVLLARSLRAAVIERAHDLHKRADHYQPPVEAVRQRLYLTTESVCRHYEITRKVERQIVRNEINLLWTRGDLGRFLVDVNEQGVYLAVSRAIIHVAPDFRYQEGPVVVGPETKYPSRFVKVATKL